MSKKYTFEPIKTIIGSRLAYCIHDDLLLFKYTCYDELVRVCINEGHIVRRDKFSETHYKRFDIKIMDIIDYGLYNKLITTDPKTIGYRFSEEIIQCAQRWKENVDKERQLSQFPPPKPRTTCEFCGDVSNKPHEFSCGLFGGMM